MRRRGRGRVILAGLAFVALATGYGLGAAADRGGMDHRHMAQTKSGAPAPKAAAERAEVSRKSPAAEYTPTVRFRLRTELADGKMAFVGVGGDIEGVVNPHAARGRGRRRAGRPRQQRRRRARRRVPRVQGRHRPRQPEGREQRHRVPRGQERRVRVLLLAARAPAGRAWRASSSSGAGKGPVAALPPSVSIAREPRGPAGPAARRPAAHRQVELEAVELVGRLANETTYNYWTFNGKVPGPFLRVRVGDTVELTFKNRKDSRMIHSVDLHAVTGPGGGAVVTQTPPGERRRSASRRSTRGSTSTTAPRRWWPTTSPAACTG